MSCPKCGGTGFSISKKDGRQKPCKLGCVPCGGGGGGGGMPPGGGGYAPPQQPGYPPAQQPGYPPQQPGYAPAPAMDQNQLWQIYQQYDTDRNGALEMREVHVMLQALGFFNGLDPQKQVQLVTAQYQANDRNRDGWIDFGEFCALYHSLNASLRQSPQYAQYAPPQPVPYMPQPGYAPAPAGYGGQPMPGGYPPAQPGMQVPYGYGGGGHHHHHHKHKHKGYKGYKGMKFGMKGGGMMMFGGGLLGGMVLAEILD
mmetsp:Transcript_38324/g.46225  ORF Transcript_38324/g.46225 Transcript_38324/m.46225 type:complete len:256 (-) Transcript_38324:493-1260(-)